MSSPIEIIRVRVYGDPKAQPRAKASTMQIGGKTQVRMYTPGGKIGGWKRLIALALMPHLPKHPLAGPVIVDADFVFHRPQSLCRKKDPIGRIRHDVKPDRDNLDKALLDLMKRAGVYHDDAQVCDGHLRKWYAAIGEDPGVELVVSVPVIEIPAARVPLAPEAPANLFTLENT